jgi:hypothetical protein
MGRPLDVEELVEAVRGFGLPPSGTRVSVRRQGSFVVAVVLEGSTAARVRLRASQAGADVDFVLPLWKLYPAPSPEPEPEDTDEHSEGERRRARRWRRARSRSRRTHSEPDSSEVARPKPSKEVRSIQQALERLGLDPTGKGVQDAAELRAAWRRRVLEAHPDKGGHEEDFLAVQGAYDYLMAKMAPKQ